MPMKTVGTPAVTVTFSPSISSTSAFGSGREPGKTCFAPIQAAANGRPQAFTWNIGTTGITASLSQMPTWSAVQIARACRQIPRWV